MIKRRIILNLDNDDINILKELINESSDCSNNAIISYSDVVSGLLNFYKHATLLDYQKQYRKNIAFYIANRVQTKEM